LTELLKFEEDSGIRPAALARRPTIQKHLQNTMQVFWELSEMRQAAMAGVNRLTLVEFNAYCRHHHIGFWDAQDLWWGVQVLDRAYKAFKADKK
jgi:hypothetical protein